MNSTGLAVIRYAIITKILSTAWNFKNIHCFPLQNALKPQFFPGSQLHRSALSLNIIRFTWSCPLKTYPGAVVWYIRIFLVFFIT